MAIRLAGFFCDPIGFHHPRAVLVWFLHLSVGHERESVDGLVRASESSAKDRERFPDVSRDSKMMWA